MALVLRYVSGGLSYERFVGVVHVEETTTTFLKSKIDFMIAKSGLSLKQVRGQGYDGASNMAGEFNGLQAKIMRDNSLAYFVHCFAHKLNLVVVAITKKITDVGDFFDMISLMVTVVGSSCKRKDKLRVDHQEEVRNAIGKGEIATGTGLNQELSLQRPGDTRWNSHYRTLVGLSKMFPSVVKVLEYVEEDGTDPIKKRQASGILKYFQSFDSVFYLHMMMIIFSLKNGLSKTFQRKDMDIVNAISDVESTKRELLKLRSEHGWNDLLDKVRSFCEKNDILVMDMENDYVNPKKIRQRTALSPSDQFGHYNVEKLKKLAQFYPDEFNDLVGLEHELDLYLDNVTHDTRFASLDNIGDLAELMVTTKKHLSYPLVYRLIKLALTLHVATATVERCFSAMKIVKNALRSKISDDFMNHSLIRFVGKELLNKIPNEVIVKRFHAVKERRGIKWKVVD
ncbi:uncharacterized protein [Aegilops tauschii subsp. strangulata]|uniref:uncharacterized protein n=1 Tax=Aegilops tauschii subsp. strangulata TaxID=200361 RepID=UPI00098AA7B3|nr:zinc finger MYM-type protein 1-like [Aegilops tauschii subsp. strangulata]